VDGHIPGGIATRQAFMPAPAARARSIALGSDRPHRPAGPAAPHGRSSRFLPWTQKWRSGRPCVIVHAPHSRETARCAELLLPYLSVTSPRCWSPAWRRSNTAATTPPAWPCSTAARSVACAPRARCARWRRCTCRPAARRQLHRPRRVRRAAAAAGLPRRHAARHRRRPAAQPGQVGRRGV